MILMIRINLLPVRERRRKREGKQILILFALLLCAQFAFLYYMHGEVEAERQHVAGQLQTVEKEIEKRRGVQTQIQELETAQKDLKSQVELFEQLKHEKEGPSKLLLFLAYVITPRDESAYNREELQKLEQMGWDTNWNPNRIWLRSMDNQRRGLEITGIAMSHEDVSEFSKRLRSAIYFPGIEPQQQIQDFNHDLDVSTVDFRLKAGVYTYATAAEHEEKKNKKRKRKRKRKKGGK